MDEELEPKLRAQRFPLTPQQAAMLVPTAVGATKVAYQGRVDGARCRRGARCAISYEATTQSTLAWCAGSA